MASFDVPQTEGPKYAGSKLRLIPRINEIVSALSGVQTVLDGFSGTTRVSQYFSQTGFDVTANDVSLWSETFGKCYLLRGKSDEFYQKILDSLNDLPPKSGWFSENYGGADDDEKMPFRLKNMQKLDAIRDEIDNLNLDEIDRAVILSSLILALDKVDSTLGHFASYLARWSPRSAKDLRLVLPRRFPVQTKNRVVRGDIFDAIRGARFDLAYFDPPYGSNNEKMPPSRVRYNSYYHFWTTVILNDRPSLFGKARRREDSKDAAFPSVFEEFRKNEKGRFIALEAIRRLIAETCARYILLSYSSGGRATKDELLEIMRECGNLKTFYEIDYKKNIMAAMKWTGEWANDGANKEYLFLLEK